MSPTAFAQLLVAAYRWVITSIFPREVVADLDRMWFADFCMTRSCNPRDTAALSVAEAPCSTFSLVLYVDTAADCKVCRQVGNARNGPARMRATSTQCDCSHFKTHLSFLI